MILNSTCGLLNMLKLIQMLSVMIRITYLAKTGDFPKYAFLLSQCMFKFSSLHSPKKNPERVMRKV